MKSISFGQFYPAESIIHKADPRTKVILAVLYIVCSFVCKNIFSFALLIASALFIVASSKIPMKTVLRSIRPVLVIMVFMSLLNIFFTHNQTIIFYICQIFFRKIFSPIKRNIAAFYDEILIIFYSCFNHFTHNWP